MADLVLPAFEMDCRDWMVVSPGEAGLPEEVDGAPLLAVLSTVLIDTDIREASGALTVGIIEPDEQLDTRPVSHDSQAYELLDRERIPGAIRYVMPAPGQRIALLAEFVIPDDDLELRDRVEHLMTSFRWQDAA